MKIRRMKLSSSSNKRTNRYKIKFKIKMKLKNTLLQRGRHKLHQVTTGRSHTCMHPVMSLAQEFLCTAKARVRLTCPSTTFNLKIKLTSRTTADGASALGPVQVRTSLLKSENLFAVLISFGRLFHTRAASNRNDLFPYAVVLTVGTLAVFSYLKL